VPFDHKIIAVNANPSPWTKELLGTKRKSFITPSAAENSRMEVKYREGLRITSFDF
jgi:hypothetical protein